MVDSMYLPLGVAVLQRCSNVFFHAVQDVILNLPDVSMPSSPTSIQFATGKRVRKPIDDQSEIESLSPRLLGSLDTTSTHVGRNAILPTRKH